MGKYYFIVIGDDAIIYHRYSIQKRSNKNTVLPDNTVYYPLCQMIIVALATPIIHQVSECRTLAKKKIDADEVIAICFRS